MPIDEHSNGPWSIFSVGVTRVSEAGVSLDQQVMQTLVDQRGRLQMPAYPLGAMTDAAGTQYVRALASIAYDRAPAF